MTLAKITRDLSGGLIDPNGPLPEGKWSTCSNPLRLLEHLNDRNFVDQLEHRDDRNVLYQRKLRLFISECRGYWGPSLPDKFFEYSREAAQEAFPLSNGSFRSARLEYFIASSMLEAKLAPLPRWSRRSYQARTEMATLLRCVFGDLFRPVVCNHKWRTPDTIALATTIYDGRAFDNLPVLADAFEEASCDNAEILNHCRQPGKHVRGCWVVDLLLGKE